MRDNKLFRKRDSQKEEEKTKLEKVKDEIKNGIYGVFYILLKSNENSFWKYSVLLAIEFL